MAPITADTVILGGATVYAGALTIWVAYRTLQCPSRQRWHPKELSRALRLARSYRVAAFVRVSDRRVRLHKPRRRSDYECVPYPMVLTGYFEE